MTYEYSKKGLYRSRHGWILGVCRGMSDYTGIPVVWIRLALLAVFVFSGFFPIIIVYVVAAIFMKVEPPVLPQTDEGWEFCNSYTSNRALALERLRRKFDQLDRRAQRLESVVTSKRFHWDQRMRTASGNQ